MRCPKDVDRGGTRHLQQFCTGGRGHVRAAVALVPSGCSRMHESEPEQPHRLLGRVRRAGHRDPIVCDVRCSRSVGRISTSALCGWRPDRCLGQRTRGRVWLSQRVRRVRLLVRRCVHSDDHEHQPNFRWTRHAGDDSRANVSTASDRCDNHCSHRSRRRVKDVVNL